MVIPSQDLIECKTCGKAAKPHKAHKLHCDACAKAKQVEYQRQYRERTKAANKTVTCKGCGAEFTTERSGRTWRCAECTRVYLAERRQKDQYRHSVYSKQYRERLGDAYTEKMRNRRRELVKTLLPDELEKFRQAERDKTLRAQAVTKDAVFKAYGGYRCVCCNETEPLFLSVDHIYNDGNKMRKKGVHAKGGTSFYQWIKRHNFPPGFQILCMNCNTGKHRNGGVCPHQSGKV